MKCGIDSGSTTSILSWKTACKYHFKINASSCKIKLADNTLELVKGISDRLLIEVKGQKAYLRFLIIDHADHDVLLGLDWFEITKAGIFPAMKIP